jgi:hypothetical protein
MLQLGVNLSMPDFTQLKPSLLVKLLRFHVPEIADAILSRIEDRTPVDTGALKEDEAVRVLKSGGELVEWYVGGEYQEAENQRVYAAYQEGPPLGQTTYTNGPHQMFARVATDDLLIIQAWANQVVAEALDNMVGAANSNTLSEVL